MKIQVTQEDIKNGIRKHACNCPVALALKRQWSPNASVGNHYYGLKNGITIPNPPEVVDFVNKFDNGFMDLGCFHLNLK